MGGYLYDLQSIYPAHGVTQDVASRWLAQIHAKAEQFKSDLNADQAGELEEQYAAILKRVGGYPDRILCRYSELRDHTHTDWSRARIFQFDKDSRGHSMTERMDFFQEVTKARVAEFYQDECDAPAAMVHVTCTGYASPSAVQSLVTAKGWGTYTSVMHAYHMGCYASLPAIRIADGYLATNPTSANKHVDVIHNELCTLHLNPTCHDMEQLVVQSLFADGHIRYRLTHDLAEAAAGGKGFEILQIHDEIVPDSDKAMSWVASDFGMKMTLSIRTPIYIQKSIRGFVERLLAKVDQDIDISKCIYAIHPGGPRIIDSVCESLELEQAQAKHSRTVLRHRGNMSSATLPHVWQEILADDSISSGTPVISMAFGPGLTVYGGLFRKL